MTKQEFETIIKPLMLLDGKQCQFMRSALLRNFEKWNETKQLTIPVVASLPKVCIGCGTLSTKVIDKKYLACCPDNQYIKLEDYCKKSVYKPELFNK